MTSSAPDHDPRLAAFRGSVGCLRVLTILSLGLFAATARGSVASIAASKPSSPPYAIVKTVVLGSPDRWDYLAYDERSNRIYVAHGDRVSVVDGSSGASLGNVTGMPGGSHGTVVTGTMGYTDDGRAGTVVPFDVRTLTSKASIKVGDDSDAMLDDPVTGLVFVVDGDPGTISVVDPRTSALVKTIDVGGKLEYAVADGLGHLYVNGEAKREVVQIDTRSARVDARWPMPDCVDPHGLAIDTTTRRLFAGCLNERMVVLNADSGAVVATVPIGRGSDAIAFDPKRRRILSANGLDGTMSVIREMDKDVYVALEPVRTMVSGRTLAVNTGTGRVYVAAAETDPAKIPGGRPVSRPGSLRLLFLDPKP